MNPNFYMHDSDKKAMQALKAVPGFDQLFKTFMKLWDEKIFNIKYMAENLRLSEKQLSKYYNMLPPICEKLGIEVPELYLTLDVNANAYTMGDTKPFIVITSGLLETLPDELIPTVLAHECGHIACHHCLYTTMADIILSEIVNLLPFRNLVIEPIKIAFAYWERCSELSADRAAILCDGKADNMIKTCMYFAGFDKDIEAEANVEEFIGQALSYKEMMDNTKLNKAMEFYLFKKRSHPISAIRAYECSKWSETEKFIKLAEFINIKNQTDNSLAEYLREIPMSEDSKYYIGKNIDVVEEELKKLGFKNVKTSKITKKGILVKEGQVLNIRINGKDGFNLCDWYAIDSEIVIEYYEAETNEEISAAHPNQLKAPNSSKYYLGRLYAEAITEFEMAGFVNIETEKQIKDKKGILNKNGMIAVISVNGQTQFEKGEWFDEKSVIKITYYIFG